MEKHMTKVAEKHGKDGLCFHWGYGCRTMVIVSSPQAVKELAFHPNLSDKPHFAYRSLTPYFLGPFITSRADDLWKLKKKEYSTFLKKSHVDRDYLNTLVKISDKLIDFMLTSPSAVDVNYGTLVLTQSVTVEALFRNETSLVYHPHVLKLMKWLKYLAPIIMGNPKLSETILTMFRKIDRIVIAEIGELRKTLFERSLNTSVSNQHSPSAKNKSLSMHMTERSIKHNDSEESIIKELQELFFTSSHTVTCALANSIIYLALLPDIQERAWKEQHQIFGNDKRCPRIEDIEQMEFLDRFIKETLRFVSPAMFAKLATGDININGITIPSGTGVMFMHRYMRMDPENWKNPEVFDPDRFLEDNEIMKHSYFPFGIGIRSCPGTYFATMEMKITLSQILRRLKLRPVQEDFRFEDIQYECAIMVEVKNPPLLKVEERA
ncbi:unnamed protein product [Nezara viridula]|uniref:Cytochrome P450 n=1 Tax=Nezara viridula TaxID=85310 RepID=A0A9P0EAJ3_NEZVI|nr:unnamed protein product [Nezara viridula]